MSEAGVDVVLVSRVESMCWLHGYTARWYRHAGPPEWPAQTTSVGDFPSFADQRGGRILAEFGRRLRPGTAWPQLRSSPPPVK